MTYTDSITRNAAPDPLVPEPVVMQIMQEMPAASAVLGLSRRVTMSANTNRMPVLSALPTAYFLTAETGAGSLKQTTEQDWANVSLVAEELAAIVPIPESYLNDAAVPIWDEVRPRLVEALGAKIDAACLFGVDRPSTWSFAIFQSAVGAGNQVLEGTGTDIAQDVSELARLIVQDGYTANGFASRPGFGWEMVGLRSTDGIPIYQPNLQSGGTSTLYGFPLQEVKSGGWDATEAVLITGDWSKSIVGMRQDVTFKVFDQGIIQDGAGNIVLNLMQQDHVALRVVMRLAFATANPVTRLNSTTQYPFGVVKGSGYTYT